MIDFLSCPPFLLSSLLPVHPPLRCGGASIGQCDNSSSPASAYDGLAPHAQITMFDVDSNGDWLDVPSLYNIALPPAYKAGEQLDMTHHSLAQTHTHRAEVSRRKCLSWLCFSLPLMSFALAPSLFIPTSSHLLSSPC